MGKIRKNYLCVFIFLIVSQRASIIDGFVTEMKTFVFISVFSVLQT